MKFAFGILQLGLGFLVTYIGYQFAQNSLVPLLTLVFLYMLHTTGELFLSPIGLSMVTKLSPKKMAGTAMGAWFLSFAIANFLGGKIAALTGSGEGGDSTQDKSLFNFETTVEEAFEMTGNVADFMDWQPLVTDVPEDYAIAKNITYQKYFNIKDWVILRESLAKETSLNEWLQKRSLQDTLKAAEDWLVRTNWDSLGTKYREIVLADDANPDSAGISFNDWLYYRPGIESLSGKADQTLASGLQIQKSIIQEARLDKYVDIFTKIGLILIAISVLIAITSFPLKKLMHGVK